VKSPMQRFVMFVAVLGLQAGLCIVAGCSDGAKAPQPESAPRERAGLKGPELNYIKVAEAYNTRARAFERLSAQVSLIIEADKFDGEGNSTGRTRDQLEGNLSVQRPQKVALRLDKVGQNVAYLGSNDFSYWWFDLTGKEPTAIVGTHLKAAPQDAADFGLPVHPLEFIELLGVMEMPGAGTKAATQASVARSRDGTMIEVTTPSRWGKRKFTLDATTYQPQRIDLLDEKGELAVGSLLSRYANVSVEGKPGSGAQIATRIELTIPASTTQVLMVMADPRVPLTVRPRAFDVMELVDAYGIKRFIDHDQIKARRALESPKPSNTQSATTPATTQVQQPVPVRKPVSEPIAKPSTQTVAPAKPGTTPPPTTKPGTKPAQSLPMTERNGSPAEPPRGVSPAVPPQPKSGTPAAVPPASPAPVPPKQTSPKPTEQPAPAKSPASPPASPK
jgi:hypothetical protein